MKIDSIKLYTGFENKPKQAGYTDAHGLIRESVEKCDDKKSDRGYYSGSFTGNNVAAAEHLNKLGKTFFDKIGKSGFFLSLLEIFEHKSSVASALVALVVAGGMRPITNLAMASEKDRDDSIYAASHAMASAAIGFIVSAIVLHPFDKAFKKIKDDPKPFLKGLEKLFDVEEIGRRKLEKSKPYKKLSKMAQMGIDTIFLGIPKAMLTIALIPIILKYLFHMEKGKKKGAAPEAVQNASAGNSQYVQTLVKGNPAFKAVEGGSTVQNNGTLSNIKKTNAPSFTGAEAKASKGLSDWIANNYYLRFYKSKFAAWVKAKTNGPKWDDMTTYMSVLGSTLISSMYVFRTLTNDKLDEKKRKTLAINDALTWGVSTAGTLWADKKLAKWWENVTTRFVANYILDHPKVKRARSLGDWDPADIKIMMREWYKPLNKRIDKINATIASPGYKGERKPLNHVKETAYKSIRDFNLDVLKNPKLTTFIDGMGVFKSLFIFGMIYRYIVPVLVMKPANYIGRKIHEKNDAKHLQQQQQQQVKVAVDKK